VSWTKLGTFSKKNISFLTLILTMIKYHMARETLSIGAISANEQIFEPRRKVPVLDINSFTENLSLCSGIQMVFSVKTFIDDGLSSSTASNLSTLGADIGQIKKRDDLPGSVMRIALDKGTEKTDLLLDGQFLLSPRGVTLNDNRLFIGTSDNIVVLDTLSRQSTTIEDELFNNIHTIEINSEGKMLITSTNSDTLIIRDQLGSNVFVWKAWEHGYDTSPSGLKYVSTKEELQKLLVNGYVEFTEENKNDKKSVILATDANLKKFRSSRGTQRQTTHISGSCWGYKGEIIASLFHQGELVIINPQSGEVNVILSGMINPHAPIKIETDHGPGYLVTDTRRAKSYIFNQNFEPIQTISFNGYEEKLWLQSTSQIDDHTFIGVDTNNHRFILVDILKREKRFIPYNNNWAVQMIIPYS